MTLVKLAAYYTIHKVLKTIAILAAPIAPFYMDRLYCDLVEGATSVHFVMMPEVDTAAMDNELELRMNLAQRASSMVLALRRKVNIKVRQPLGKLVIPVLDNKTKERLEMVKSLILTEVNVKEAEFITDASGIITKKIKPNFKVLGKRYGARMKEIASAFASLDQATIGAIQTAEAAGDEYRLPLGDFEVHLAPGDYEISSEDMPGWLVANDGPLTLALDVTLTDELIREGIARELINRIQNLRKDSGFEVTDKVNVVIYAQAEDYKAISAALEQHASYIAGQTLSLNVSAQEGISDEGTEVEWNEGRIRIKVTKN